jgi:hypothetical protein
MSLIPGRKKAQPAAADRGLAEAVPAAELHLATQRPAGLKRRLWGWLLCRAPREPLPSHLGTVEPPGEGKLGICCSGGGIRSAAFCLGALQALEERDELRKASYLAAVSGGSYIAAAISMVAKKSEHDGEADSDPGLFDSVGPFAQGSPEEQYLRNRASYLAPTLADKLYLGLRLILGLLFNLLLLSLPLIGLALVFAGLLLVPLVPGLAGHCPDATAVCGKGAGLDLPLGFVLAPLIALGLTAIAGLASMLVRWKEGPERFFSTWAVRCLVLAAGLALLLVAVPYLVELVREQGHETTGSTASHHAGQIGSATLALLLGVVVQLAHLLNSKAAREELGRAGKLFEKLGSGLRLAVTYGAAAIVGPALLFGIFVFATSAAMAEAHSHGEVSVGLTMAGLAVLAAFGLVYEFVDLSTWSLHPYYRRRLSKAFALKRVRAEADPERRAELPYESLPPAAGDSVGIAVERDYDDQVQLSETALKGGEGEEWPTLLVCAAANISDSAATPPGRAVTSFTFSANTVGGPLVGAVPMREMESVFDRPRRPRLFDPPPERNADGEVEVPVEKRRRDLTLPAAMAMSGAAISPSMGKMTRRPLTFLMALANIRLGVWVPNPRWIEPLRENEHLRERNVRPRPSYLLRELLGLNRIGAKYLYITDGGHYENLGLVELLRRGCTDVYCLDASGVGGDGAEFGALGEAIALARSELDVEIEFGDGEGESPERLVASGEDGIAARDVVVGTIRFPPRRPGEEGPTGTLVYVRNTMTAEAPWDVRAHHEADSRFPNNPTVDQLYTDQKFEAYRALGVVAGANARAALR